MTHDDFRFRVRRYRRDTQLVALGWLASPFLIWLAFRLVRPFTSEVFAGWLTVTLVGVWAVLPMFIFSQLARRLGLFCPVCGVRDRCWSFIRGVQRDGRCPRCKKEVLNAV